MLRYMYGGFEQFMMGIVSLLNNVYSKLAHAIPDIFVLAIAHKS